MVLKLSENMREIPIEKKSPDYIDIRWHWEDVKMCAEDNEIEITEQQSRQILQALKHGHDAGIGINWDVILFEIENYLECNK